MRSRIAGLTASRELPRRDGAFDARLADGRAASLVVALTSAPTAWRRPLAFYRLARALDATVVPAVAARPIGFGELGALVSADAEALAMIRGRAAVQNDGTVDALLSARSTAAAGSPWEAPAGSAIDPKRAAQIAIWERWASSPAPAPGEDARLLRGFVEMLALDYVAGHVARRRALIAGGAIVLDENGEAFPLHVEPTSLDQLLRRLKRVARFPRPLRAALARLDRARASELFAGGGFDAWLLSPRALVELDERRAGLLSLIEARIAERGEAAVLSL